VPNDDNDAWIEPAFAEIYRVRNWNRFVPTNGHRLVYAMPLFAAAFLGHCFAGILAPRSFASSAFPVPPEITSKIQANVALGGRKRHFRRYTVV
jgi:hypothetical protein